MVLDAASLRAAEAAPAPDQAAQAAPPRSASVRGAARRPSAARVAGGQGHGLIGACTEGTPVLRSHVAVTQRASGCLFKTLCVLLPVRLCLLASHALEGAAWRAPRARS